MEGGGLNIGARGRLISRGRSPSNLMGSCPGGIYLVIGFIFCFQVDGLITGGKGTYQRQFSLFNSLI